jgi:hypothetical protein
VEDHAAVETRHEERKISFAWISRFYIDQFRNLPEYFRLARAIQICTLRLFVRRILAREDMFP